MIINDSEQIIYSSVQQNSRFILWKPRTQKSADICVLQSHRVSVSMMKCAGPLRQWGLIPINIPLSLISIKVRVIRRCYGRRPIAAHVDDVTRCVLATSSGKETLNAFLFLASHRKCFSYDRNHNYETTSCPLIIWTL